MSASVGSGSRSWERRASPGRHFSAPLGPAASGRLVFTDHTAGLVLLAAPALDSLARARFGERLAWVGFEAGLLLVAYHPEASTPPAASQGRAAASPAPVDEITLNASIPWEIEFRGAAARVAARLGGLQLRSLDLLGGASQIVLELARPVGAAYLYLAGGAHRVTLRRPPGVGVRVMAQDGVSHLALDGRLFRSLGRDTRLESAGFDPASAWYEVRFAGQASDVRIDEWG